MNLLACRTRRIRPSALVWDSSHIIEIILKAEVLTLHEKCEFPRPFILDTIRPGRRRSNPMNSASARMSKKYQSMHF